jgi:hypothetical protein
MRQRLIAFVVGILLIAAVVIAMLYMILSAPSRLAESALRAATEKRESRDDLADLVIRVRGLARLETVTMRVMHVGRIRQSYGFVPDQLAGDEITFLAVGDVVAGINLAVITRQDVRVDRDGTLVMRLPASEIFMTRLDNRESHILNRDTGLLRRADPGLETKVRQFGEASIRAEAMRKGILPIANQNAEARLADFLHTVNFQKVRFERRLVTVEP